MEVRRGGSGSVTAVRLFSLKLRQIGSAALLCFHLQLLSHLLIISGFVVHHHPGATKIHLQSQKLLVAFKKCMPNTYLFREFALGEITVSSLSFSFLPISGERLETVS